MAELYPEITAYLSSEHKPLPALTQAAPLTPAAIHGALRPPWPPRQPPYPQPHPDAAAKSQLVSFLSAPPLGRQLPQSWQREIDLRPAFVESLNGDDLTAEVDPEASIRRLCSRVEDPAFLTNRVLTGLREPSTKLIPLIPGSPIYERFVAACRADPTAKLCLVFHGAPTSHPRPTCPTPLNLRLC